MHHSLKRDDIHHFVDLSSSSHFESHRSIASPTLSSTQANIALGSHRSEQVPYIEAIRCIERMQTLQSPREKLQCITESFSCMKTAIVDYWKGKVELNTMDDVLPLTIYAVCMADLTHPASELNIIEDYLSVYDKGFDYERKLLTNFDVSIKYINKEWNLEETRQ